ncbi:MAG: tetratricopeptide repeat protein [Planctomycetes bacterium]|nr:tetratricopeptide repeat protein [Planctomycetota bacterium]
MSILAASLVVSLIALDRARRSAADAHEHAQRAERAAAVLAEEKATVAGVVEVLRSTVTRAIGKDGGDDASIAAFCRELEAEVARDELPLRTRALTANYLATVRFANGDWPASEVLCRRALDLMTAAGLESTPEGILAHGALSEVLRNVGRHDEAEEVLARGLALAEAELPPSDLTLLSMLRRRVLLDLEQRRFDRTRELAVDVLQRRRIAFGDDADETFESAIDLAQCALAAGSDDGIELARATLARRNDTARPHDGSTLALRLNLGVVLARKADWAAAIDELQRARASAARLLAPDHPRIAAIEANLGAIQLAAGDPAAAVPNLEAAADHFAARLSVRHPQRLSSLGWLARALRLAGRHAEAAERLALHSTPSPRLAQCRPRPSTRRSSSGSRPASPRSPAVRSTPVGKRTLRCSRTARRSRRAARSSPRTCACALRRSRRRAGSAKRRAGSTAPGRQRRHASPRCRTARRSDAPRRSSRRRSGRP